jgi:hypothetical protein
MKTAIYINDGMTQVVLTPETKLEETLLANVDTQSSVTIHHGTFYRCRGGWVTEGDTNQSLMLILEPPKLTPLGHEPLP